MGKGTELDDELRAHPLKPEEMEAMYPPLPELRLRADVPAVKVDSDTKAQAVLGRLLTEGSRSIAFEDGDKGTVAVLVPVDRYVQLVSAELANSHEVETRLDGRITPRGLATSDVEQVDPQATWIPVAGYPAR